MRSIDVGKRLVLLLLAMLALAACASGQKTSELDKVQYAYSAAIRWGDFEGAWQLVDPEYRQAHPLSALELERYKQIQVAGYRDVAVQTLPDGDVVREIQIDLVNRHTLTERSTRYTERWHFEPEAKTWWLVGGLPDDRREAPCGGAAPRARGRWTPHCFRLRPSSATRGCKPCVRARLSRAGTPSPARA